MAVQLNRSTRSYWIGVSNLPKTHYQNRLLSSLASVIPSADLDNLQSEEVHPGQLLQTPSEALLWLYFPETAQLSLQIEKESSYPVEVMTVGAIGAASLLPLSLEAQAVYRCVVIQGGKVWRIPVKWLVERAQSDTRLLRSILLYNEAIANQIALTAFCNAHHGGLQRLCRWILQLMDQSDKSTLSIPLHTLQCFKTETPAELHQKIEFLESYKAIELNKNQVTVLERSAIERRSCSCHVGLRDGISTLLSSLQKI